MLRDTVYCYWLGILLPTCGMLRDTVYCCWLGVLLPYMWHVEGYSALLFSVLLHVNIISTNLVYYYLHASCWGIQCTVIGLVYYCPTCGMLRNTMHCYWLCVLLPYMWHVEGYSALLLSVLLPYMWHISTNYMLPYMWHVEGYNASLLSVLLPYMWHISTNYMLPYMWHVEGYSALLLSVLLPYMWHISTNYMLPYMLHVEGHNVLLLAQWTIALHVACWEMQCIVIGLLYYCPACGMLRDTVYD